MYDESILLKTKTSDKSEELTRDLIEAYCSHPTTKSDTCLKCKSHPLICGHNNGSWSIKNQTSPAENSEHSQLCLYPFKYDTFSPQSKDFCNVARELCLRHQDWENVLLAHIDLEIISSLEMSLTLEQESEMLKSRIEDRQETPHLQPVFFSTAFD